MDDGIKELKEYVLNLTPEAQKVLLSSEWRDKLRQIAEKYVLNLNQTNDLEYEVLFILIGMEPEKNLSENIKNELQISELLANQITEEINNRVFPSIFDAIEKLKNKAKILPNPLEIEPAPLVDKSTISVPRYTAPAPSISTETTQKPWLKPIPEHLRETPRNTPEVPINLPGMDISSGQNQNSNSTSSSSRITYKPVPQRPFPEQTQKPITQEQPMQNPSINSVNTSSPIPQAPTSPRIDPYREPVE